MSPSSSRSTADTRRRATRLSARARAGPRAPSSPPPAASAASSHQDRRGPACSSFQRLPRPPGGRRPAASPRSTRRRRRPAASEYLATKLNDLREAARRQHPDRRRRRPDRRLDLPVRRSSTTSRPSSPWRRSAWTSPASATTSSTRAPTELLRIQNGGCHPEDGCYFPDDPYDGADFHWLAANVFKQGHRQAAPARHLGKKVDGVKVGFIGMTLEATPTLVAPAASRRVDFTDEVETANAQAAALKAAGRRGDRRADARGRLQTGHATTGASASPDPSPTSPSGSTPPIDASSPATPTSRTSAPSRTRAGNPRMVTSAASYGQVVTESDLSSTGDRRRRPHATHVAVNHLVTARAPRTPPRRPSSPSGTPSSAPLAAAVVGTVAAGHHRRLERQPRHRDADGRPGRRHHLRGTESADGGAQIALDERRRRPRQPPVDADQQRRAPGEITYAEAYTSRPSATCWSARPDRAQIERSWRSSTSRSRPRLAADAGARRLRGLHLHWDETQPQGSRVVAVR